jgi:hypothetical protein
MLMARERGSTFRSRPGTHLATVGQTWQFTPLSFAEKMAAMVLFGLTIALAARSQIKLEMS